MPQRNRTKQITGGPQGDDATLTIFMPTYGEARQYAKKLSVLTTKITAVSEAVDAANSSASDDAAMRDTTARIEALTDEMTEITTGYLSDHVIAWNWVDDEGEDLAKPFHNPEVFSALTNEEMQFVTSALNGATAQQEESRKKLRTQS